MLEIEAIFTRLTVQQVQNGRDVRLKCRPVSKGRHPSTHAFLLQKKKHQNDHKLFVWLKNADLLGVLLIIAIFLVSDRLGFGNMKQGSVEWEAFVPWRRKDFRQTRDLNLDDIVWARRIPGNHNPFSKTLVKENMRAPLGKRGTLLLLNVGNAHIVLPVNTTYYNLIQKSCTTKKLTHKHFRISLKLF